MSATISHGAPPHLRRAATLAGAAGLILFLTVWFEAPDGPPHNATADAVRTHFEANITAIARGVFASSLAFGALLLLIVGLRQLMRAAESNGRLLTDLATASGVLVAMWFWLQASTELMPLVMADDDGKLSGTDNQSLLTLDLFGRLGETFGDLSAVPRGLLILAPSLLALRTRFLPRWIGYFGLFVSAASLISIVGFLWPIPPFGVAAMVGLFGFPVWVLLISCTLLVQSLRARRAQQVT